MERTSSLGASALRLFARISFVLGWLSIGYWPSGTWGLIATLRWDSVEGTVVRSDVHGRHPSIGYSYVYRGKKWISNRVHPVITGFPTDSMTYSTERARELVKQNPVGSKVTVHLDPRSPNDRSCINRDGLFIRVLHFLLTLLLLGLPVLYWLVTGAAGRSAPPGE